MPGFKQVNFLDHTSHLLDHTWLEFWSTYYYTQFCVVLLLSFYVQVPAKFQVPRREIMFSIILIYLTVFSVVWMKGKDSTTTSELSQYGFF